LGGMRSAVTIAIILVLVAFRFILPPFPRVIKTYADKWGKWTTIMLCAVAAVGAALMILVSRR
jgi:hypothetical protein